MAGLDFKGFKNWALVPSRRVLVYWGMLRATAMRSCALCAVLVAAALIGGVDSAKKSPKGEKWQSVRAWAGNQGDKVEVRADAGDGDRVLVAAPPPLSIKVIALL